MDVTGPGRQLHARFLALGDMTGKTGEEIIALVGPPSSRSFMAGDNVLLQWQATGYHIAVLFGADGRFLKITHESAHYAPAPAGCLTVAVLLLIAIAIITAVSLLALL